MINFRNEIKGKTDVLKEVGIYKGQKPVIPRVTFGITGLKFMRFNTNLNIKYYDSNYK